MGEITLDMLDVEDRGFDPKPRLPFLTGSRIYGTPKSSSDLDMVIRVTAGEAELLRSQADTTEPRFNLCNSSSTADVSVPFRFGNLNLLCCLNDQRYDSFARARARCLAEAPVTRDRAIQIHKEERAKEGKV